MKNDTRNYGKIRFADGGEVQRLEELVRKYRTTPANDKQNLRHAFETMGQDEKDTMRIDRALKQSGPGYSEFGPVITPRGYGPGTGTPPPGHVEGEIRGQGAIPDDAVPITPPAPLTQPISYNRGGPVKNR